MKALFLSWLCFFILQDAFGQVSGKLVTANGRPLPFVSVFLLKSSDTSIVRSMLSDESGSFRVDNISSGSYLIRLSSIGHQTWTSPVFEITVNKPGKDLGTIVMNETTRQLGEVVIRADHHLYQQRSDGLVVNVASSVLTKGSSALQVLERSPGVVIDHRNNGINLNGKSGVMVMMDGKLMRMPIDQVVTLLNGMSADNIEKIELLTTPPAGYDAEGSAGIINIVSKKNKKQGTSGSYTLTGGYGWGEKGSGSINLAHNTDKVNLYGSYTFAHDNTYSDFFVASAQNMPFLGGDMKVTGTFTTKRIQNNHNAIIGADFKLNPKTTIGGSISYNNSHSSVNSYNHGVYNVLPDSLLTYDGYINGTNTWKNLISSFNIEKVISEGEKLNFDMDYIHYSNNGPTEVQSSFVNKYGQQVAANNSVSAPRQNSFANTSIKVGVAKADYFKQLNAKVKLETGIKGTYTTSSSSSGIQSLVAGKWVNNTETATEIYMKEGIGAAYASVNAQLSASTSLVVGARYEYSYTNMDDPKTGQSIVDRKLGVLFPSILFSKKLNENSELQLSYTKRISRPSYNDLASYVGYSDPTAVYTGNPFLKPTITNNIKLGYTYRDYSFSLLFSRDDHPITRYQLGQGPLKDLLYISPQNLTYLDNITLQVNLPFKVNDWWSMNYGFTGGMNREKGNYTIHPFQKNTFIYSLNFNESFRLPKKFSFELSGWYNSLAYNGTSRVDGFGSLDAGIKKELKNNGGSFQLAVTDILRTVRIKVRYGTITEEPFAIRSFVDVHTESSKFPIIKLSYSKSFGGTRSTGQDKQDSGTKDERDRMKKD
jgi:iron complex outermembrane receptor protein